MDTSGGPRASQDAPVLPQHLDHALQRPPTPLQRAESPRSPEDWSVGDGGEGRRSAGLTPPQASPCPPGRQNQVSTVVLHGVPIVSLNIDNKERLCLAQISNTLLKDYSYNEIHNRRVALGITCVQCTPVQLEILRRAGAMPVSSRRCGMITKREAERLVKSFLEDSEPPKLPEGFAFQVYHECGWGCHGYFEPARYNSSRAKCIKCGYCSVYFSPNKFIFHFHRTSEAKYHHPDAANFNSWRRHLKLAASDLDNEMHLWEDVKAMFNGGTRKRIFSTSRSSSSCPRSDPPQTSDLSKKSSKTSSSGGGSDMPVISKHPFSNHFSPYPWYGSGPKPSYPFVSVNTSQSLCFGFPPPAGPGKDGVPTPEHPPILKGGITPMAAPWLGRTPLPFSNLDAFWDKAFGLPRPMGPGLRSVYPPVLPKSAADGPLNECLGGGMDGRGESGDRPSEDGVSERKRPRKDLYGVNIPNGHHGGHHRQGCVPTDRLSAFRPVGRNMQHVEEDEHNMFVEEEEEEEEEEDEERVDDEDAAVADDLEDNEEIDVTEEDCCTAEDLSRSGERRCSSAAGSGDDEGDDKRHEDQQQQQQQQVEERPQNKGSGSWAEVESQDKMAAVAEDDVSLHDHPNCSTSGRADGVQDLTSARNWSSEATGAKPRVDDEKNGRLQDNGITTAADDSGLSDESEADAENEDGQFLAMSKEELCQSLKKELCFRKKREKEVSLLRETFQEEVSREKAFRDQMARQLEVLRETLTNELEQERKVRFSLQQKLKEAHDALHSFSCSMLTAARDCGFKDTMLPR